MKPTFLVQRLGPPPKSAFAAKVSQAFGGGMLQLKQEAWGILQTVFDIEYMGAAEYEFGALPRSLQDFASDRADLEAYVLFLKPHEMKPNPRRMTKAPKKPKRGKATVDTPIYVLCRKQHVDEVFARIRLLAQDKIRTKNGSYLAYALDPVEEFDRRTCGWYELDNGFFFFTDKEMWERATHLFKSDGADSTARKG